MSAKEEQKQQKVVYGEELFPDYFLESRQDLWKRINKFLSDKGATIINVETSRASYVLPWLWSFIDTRIFYKIEK
jgi:hypothetical protein